VYLEYPNNAIKNTISKKSIVTPGFRAICNTFSVNDDDIVS